MSDKPISVGDLVMVTRATKCCGQSHRFSGLVFTVEWIEESSGECAWCGDMHPSNLIAGFNRFPDAGFPLYMLKRIPPLEELDDIKRDEEIEA